MLDHLSLMLGTANLLIIVLNIFAYARYLRRGIPDLLTCLIFAVCSFVQGAIGIACLILPQGDALFRLAGFNMALSLLTNTLLTHLLIGIAGGRSPFLSVLRKALYLVPIAAFLCAATNPLHGGLLLFVEKAEDGLGYFVRSGAGYNLISLISGVAMMAVFVVLLLTYRKNPSISRASVTVVFLSAFLPSLVGWVEGYTLMIDRAGNYISLTMGWLPLCAICYVYFGYLRTARHNAIGYMQEGFAVFDRQGNCVDANKAFEAFGQEAFGQERPPIARLLSIMEIGAPKAEADVEFELMKDSKIRYYTARFFRVSDGINRSCGDGILFREVTSVKERMERLDSLALNDELTGAGNRRFLYDRGAEMLSRAAEGARPVTMLMFDIDHFKRINDAYGHPAGDDVLVALCRVCEENLRRDDLLVRYGGEEFIVLCEDMSREAGVALAERLHGAIRAQPVETREGPVGVTVSIGGCTFDARPDDGIDHWINTADRALYRAKRSGRDRIVYAEPEGEEDEGIG